jgi:formylglycine-generating enzyme required for sulfatase activity
MFGQWMRDAYGPAGLLLLILAFATSPGVAAETIAKQAGHDDRLCNSYSGLPSEGGDKAGMVFIPRGSFTMGSDNERPEERYSHVVQVDSFWIDRHEVTNAQFARFVEATGYATLAERGLDPNARKEVPVYLRAEDDLPTDIDEARVVRIKRVLIDPPDQPQEDLPEVLEASPAIEKAEAQGFHKPLLIPEQGIL